MEHVLIVWIQLGTCSNRVYWKQLLHHRGITLKFIVTSKEFIVKTIGTTMYFGVIKKVHWDIIETPWSIKEFFGFIRLIVVPLGYQ